MDVSPLAALRAQMEAQRDTIERLFGAPARRAQILRNVCVLLVLLGLAVLPAQAQGAPASFVLTWQHQQDASTPATGYAVQRCIQSDTACNMSDLPGATRDPLRYAYVYR